jgi:hypothetical protein
MRIKSGERRTQVRWLASIYEQVAAHKLKKVSNHNCCNDIENHNISGSVPVNIDGDFD